MHVDLVAYTKCEYNFIEIAIEICIRKSFYRSSTDGKEKLYSVCYDDDRASAIYSTHTIDLAGKGEFFNSQIKKSS